MSRFAAIHSPAGKSGNPDGSRTSRAANATSTPGQQRSHTGAGGSKVARSANLQRFAGFAAMPEVLEGDPAPTLTGSRLAPLTRSELMRQAAEGMPATPEAAAAQTIKVARTSGLIPKTAAQPKLPNPETDPGAYAVALARRVGVIR